MAVILRFDKQFGNFPLPQKKPSNEKTVVNHSAARCTPLSVTPSQPTRLRHSLVDSPRGNCVEIQCEFVGWRRPRKFCTHGCCFTSTGRGCLKSFISSFLLGLVNLYEPWFPVNGIQFPAVAILNPFITLARKVIVNISTFCDFILRML